MLDKTGNIEKRIFVENMLSFGFFRVPEFREKFLKTILEKSKNEDIPEWRNSEFSLKFNSEYEISATS
jgi:hypothetical protein